MGGAERREEAVTARSNCGARAETPGGDSSDAPLCGGESTMARHARAGRRGGESGVWGWCG